MSAVLSPGEAARQAAHPPGAGTSVGTLIGFIGMHLACFGAYWTGVSLHDLTVFAVLYVLRVFGITAGYHRYFSHRAFKTSRVFQFVLAFLAQSSLQSGAIWWAAKHRDHHRHTDTPDDVHSPVRHGFWFSHLGWIFSMGTNQADYGRVGDLLRFPELVWLNRNRFLAGVVTGLLTWRAFGWSGLVVGFCWSTVALYHATFSVNSFAHLFGSRRYDTADDSRNNFWVAVFIFGEGWHNNHHHYMACARQGLRWWEIDCTWYLLRLLACFGIVWCLREPPEHLSGAPIEASAGVER